MKTFTCPNCGGELRPGGAGTLTCAYCGTRSYISDREMREYGAFREAMLLSLGQAANDESRRRLDRLWDGAEAVSLPRRTGGPVKIRYLFHGTQDGVEIYTARRSAVFVLPPEGADRFLETASSLRFPAADVQGLAAYFPTVTGRFELADGRTALSVAKAEGVFPLSAFGSLPPAHAAWIVSRLENLCCALAFSDLCHGGIGTESAFIDAATHEAFLLGGWWNARSASGGGKADLLAVRKTAARVMGETLPDAPAAFRDFINGPPKADAYADFAAWDKVIEQGFGGRRFRTLDLSQLKTDQ